jgi:hypothetical protein
VRERRIAIILCVAFLSIPAFAEDADVSAWFRADPRGKAYRSVEGQVTATFAAASDAGLPLWILMEKLREGAAKGVGADRLATGLEQESRRLLEARDILLGQKVPIMDPRTREETMKAISIALLSGLSPAIIAELFSLAAPPLRIPQDAVAALAAIIPVRDASRLAESDIRRLGAALLASRLSPAAFKSVSSFFLKARASGARDEDVLETMVIRSLEAGGGLVQMEEELRIFLKRRGSR